MEERVNKFKPISKKQVLQMASQTQKTVYTNESKLLSNSQTKPFIRKPVVKRHGFASPNIIKRQMIQNQQLKSPRMLKNKNNICTNSHSDQDYWQIKQKCLINNKITIKKKNSNKQEYGIQNQNNLTNLAIKQAYFGNDIHALTQAGQVCKGEGLQSDQSQKDSYLKQNNKKKGRQNIVTNSINISNIKKMTRTQYFQNTNNQQTRSNTSRSLKDKQLNFLTLRKQTNTNQAYITNLQSNIRKLQKQNYTINKKCKWMHQEVQMHLEKEHLMISEIKGYQAEIKNKELQIVNLNAEIKTLKNQLHELKLELERKQILIKNNSLKEIQTISSLKDISHKLEDKILFNTGQEKYEDFFNGCYQKDSINSSRQKNKKLSFKTYPGVCSPKRRNQQSSKCSSISGNNESFQDIGQSSLKSSLNLQINQKSQVRKSLIKQQSKLSSNFQEIIKQRDQLKISLKKLEQQIKELKYNNQQRINKNNEQIQQKISIHEQQLNKIKKDLKNQTQQKNSLNQLIQCIENNHKNEIQNLNLKIKQLQTQLQMLNTQTSKNTMPQDLKDIQFQNPLKYLIQQRKKSILTEQTTQNHIEAQNKSLKIYIQTILEHYKYIKIQNRMLLKLKEDLQKMQKQKKQLKQQRDMFKKKLLENVKNKNSFNKNSKNKTKFHDFDSQSSQSESQSAVFQLSQSQILHTESDVKMEQEY